MGLRPYRGPRGCRNDRLSGAGCPPGDGGNGDPVPLSAVRRRHPGYDLHAAGGRFDPSARRRTLQPVREERAEEFLDAAFSAFDLSEDFLGDYTLKAATVSATINEEGQLTVFSSSYEATIPGPPATCRCALKAASADQPSGPSAPERWGSGTIQKKSRAAWLFLPGRQRAALLGRPAVFHVHADAAPVPYMPRETVGINTVTGSLSKNPCRAVVNFSSIAALGPLRLGAIFV